MRIGVNCLRIFPNYSGGVNSFTLGLLSGFAASANARAHDFVIVVTPQNRSFFSRFESVPNFRFLEIDDYQFGMNRFRARVAATFSKLPWRLRYRLPLLSLNNWLYGPLAARLADEADLFYVPYAPPPLFAYPDKPTVYSIHDLQHVHFPEFFTPEQRLERDALFAACVRHSALLQATSRQMKDEFLAHFGFLDSSQIPLIPEGVDIDAFHQPLLGNVKARYNLPEEFLFYPAQLWHHKNHITILKALHRLKQSGKTIPLVLTGARYEASQYLFDFINTNQLSEQVFHLGILPYEDVIALHRAARFMITASVYEAGSIPILEAAAAGTPILASDVPSHAEHAETLKIHLFPPKDDAALATLLDRVWADEPSRHSQIEHNNFAIKEFSWKNAAERYVNAFVAAAQGTRKS